MLVLKTSSLQENHAPAFDPSIMEFAAYTGQPYEFAVGASDTDGDALTFSASDPEHGEVVALGGGRFVYISDEGFTGVDAVRIEVSDGNGGSDFMTFVATVNASPPDGSQSPETPPVEGEPPVPNQGEPGNRPAEAETPSEPVGGRILPIKSSAGGSGAPGDGEASNPPFESGNPIAPRGMELPIRGSASTGPISSPQSGEAPGTGMVLPIFGPTAMDALPFDAMPVTFG